MKVLGYIAALSLLIGCQNTKDDNKQEKAACKPAMNDTYIVSTDDTANLTTLENFGTTAVEIGKSFDKTSPSGLSWLIKDGLLLLEGETYSLAYDQEADYWSVIDRNGAMKGNLTPYKTESCDTVSSIRLVMFIPAEEATASIWYKTL